MSRRILLGLALMGCLVLAPASASASAPLLTVSGVVTDSATGAAVAGASVHAYSPEAVNDYGTVTADSQGRWERQLAPGSYWFDVSAPGYYDQNIGSPLADEFTDSTVQVTTTGANRFDTSLAPNSKPYISIDAHDLSWAHSTRKGLSGFSDMFLNIDDGAYVAVPADWPADSFVVEIADASGRVLERNDGNLSAHGGGGTWWSRPTGSSFGCGYFNDVADAKLHVDPRHLRVLAFLSSEPNLTVSLPITVDDSQCSQTQLRVTHFLSKCDALVQADMFDRAPGGESVPGVLTYTINRRKTLRFRETKPNWSESPQLMHWLHLGRNTIRVSFTPADHYYATPAPRLLHLKVKKKAKLTGLPGGC